MSNFEPENDVVEELKDSQEILNDMVENLNSLPTEVLEQLLQNLNEVDEYNKAHPEELNDKID